MADWSRAKAAVRKAVGDEAQVPDLPASIAKGYEALAKAAGRFERSVADCGKDLADLQRAGLSLDSAIKQFMTSVRESDFALDPKDRNAAKQIGRVQKYLRGVLQSALKETAADAKALATVEKQLALIAGYERPAKPL